MRPPGTPETNYSLWNVQEIDSVVRASTRQAGGDIDAASGSERHHDLNVSRGVGLRCGRWRAERRYGQRSGANSCVAERTSRMMVHGDLPVEPFASWQLSP